MSIEVKKLGVFENTVKGHSETSPVLEARLKSQSGVSLAVLSFGATVRDFKATTTASTSAPKGLLGTPMVCTTRMPARTRLLAKSVAPVKSSAMQPSLIFVMAFAAIQSQGKS